MAFLKEKDKEFLRQKFASEFDKDVELLFFKKSLDCEYCEDEENLLRELAETSDKIHLTIKNIVLDKSEAENYSIVDAPALAILRRENGKVKDFGVRFYGIPAGYEFSALIESITLVSQGKAGVPSDIEDKLKNLDKDITILVFVTPTCPYCPRAVLTSHKFAIASDKIRGYMVEAMEFPQWADRYFVHAVPKIVINDVVEFEGAYPEPFFAEKVLEAAALTKG